jgi:hypothetical protein
MENEARTIDINGELALPYWDEKIQDNASIPFRAKFLTQELEDKIGAYQITAEGQANKAIEKLNGLIEAYNSDKKDKKKEKAMMGYTKKVNILTRNSLMEFFKLIYIPASITDEQKKLIASDFNTDFIGDAVKKMQIRLNDGTLKKSIQDTYTELPVAMQGIFDDLIKKTETGQITAAEMMQRSSELIVENFDTGKITKAVAGQLQAAAAGTKLNLLTFATGGLVLAPTAFIAGDAPKTVPGIDANE